MASFRKRTVDGKTRWDATVTKRGAPRQTRTFATRASAEAWAREVQDDIERGAWRSTRAAERMTVADLMDAYVRDVIPALKSRGTWTSNARLLKASDLGTIPLIALNPARISRYRDQRLQAAPLGGGQKGGRGSARRMSPETVRKELLFLKRAIDYARTDCDVHLPAGNPVTQVKLPPTGRARERRLEGDEFERILAAARTSRQPRLAVAIELAVETAMRRGELCNLQWSDVNLSRRIARARETKNGESRDVPLSSRAVELIRSLPRPEHDGPVLGMRPGGFTQAFERLCTRLGLPDLRLHDLRHEGTSRIVEKLGGDIIATSAITGHKTLQMLKRYTHPRPEELARRLG